MNPITFEQALETLGLIPFDEFQAMIQKVNESMPERLYHAVGSPEYMEFPYRRTGRTTKMLVKAVLQSQHTKVYIAGHNCLRTKDLYHQAVKMAEKLGIDSSNIIPPTTHYEYLGGRGVDYFIYEDHFAPPPKMTVDPLSVKPGQVYRHLKRGTFYTVLSVGEDVDDYKIRVSYRAHLDGKVWTRQLDIFADGRYRLCKDTES